MKTKRNTDASYSRHLKLGQPRLSCLTRQMTNPHKVQKKPSKLKCVLIPPSKVKKPKRPSAAHKEIPLTEPVYALDKKRHFYHLHEALITKLMANRIDNIGIVSFHNALHRRLPQVTPELSKFIYSKYRRSFPPPLHQHPLYHPARSVLHQQYIAKLRKENHEVPKFIIVKRLKEHFPKHEIQATLVDCYLKAMPQLEKKREKKRKRKPVKQASSFSKTNKPKTPPPFIPKESVFFSETRYVRPQHTPPPEKPPPEPEQDPAIRRVFFSFESPDGVAKRDVAPLNMTQFRFLAKLIKNYPKMEIKTYVTTLQGQFPQLAVKSDQMCQYINKHFKELLDIIKSNKRLASTFTPPLTNSHTAFITNQMRDFPSRNIHHIFTALASEFPKVTTFNYNTVKTFVQNNTNEDEFTRRLPRAGYRSFRDCHKQFLDRVYSESPDTALMRAYSDMLIAFPDDYVSLATIEGYLCNATLEPIDQDESD